MPSPHSFTALQVNQSLSCINLLPMSVSALCTSALTRRAGSRVVVSVVLHWRKRHPQPQKCGDLPFILDVLVDASSYYYCNQSVVPGGDEHERQTQAHPQEGQGPAGHTDLGSRSRKRPDWVPAGRLSPVVELEARPPVGGAKQSLDSAGQVDKEVTHEEEPGERQDREGHGCGRSLEVPVLLSIHIHGEYGSHSVHRSDEDADLADRHREQQPPGGLTVGLPLAKDLRQRGTNSC